VSYVEPRPKPSCPFCGEQNHVTLVAPIGGQLITSHWHCDACHTYFEAIRTELEGEGGGRRDEP